MIQKDKVITIETMGLTLNELGDYTGVVTSVEVSTTPVIADLREGTTEVHFDVHLDTYPENGKIETTITDSVDLAVLQQFQNVADTNGVTIEQVLFTIPSPKRIRPEWQRSGPKFQRHGLRRMVASMQCGRSGLVMKELMLLKAEYDSTYVSPTPDAQGNTEFYVFKIYSPNGLSIYGMVSAKVKETAVVTQAPNIAPMMVPSGIGFEAYPTRNPILIVGGCCIYCNYGHVGIKVPHYSKKRISQSGFSR